MGPRERYVHLSDVERERLYRIKKAVAEGTYNVSADALAETLLESMLECHADGSTQTTGPLQTAVQAPQVDQKKG
jgi:Anti-sigma-28 factor, FlgM